MLDFFAAQPSCTLALEACGRAHHWARQLIQLDQPDPRKVVSGADGSVTVTAWTAPPAGMQREVTITQTQWTFAPDGAVTSKTLKTAQRN